MSAPDPGFGVYVHWPFCETICPYCDFNVHVARDIDQDAWRRALTRDLEHVAADTRGRTVTSLYFGGGTPSLMPPETVAAVIDRAQALWAVADDIEITLEVNPAPDAADRLAGYRTAGVNRVSVGVQSLDDARLRFLGREHSAADAGHTLARAQATFARTTFDLIYACPGQSLDDWRAELDRALAANAGHLSLYQLTIESGTPFKKIGVEPAPEDTAADMFELTQDVLCDAGMPAYEVSNHARPGDESRHNLTCWRGGDYAGIGPGAHGRLTLDGATYGTHQIHNPARWIAKTDADGHGTAKRRPIGAADRARELVMMGLRLAEGVDGRLPGVAEVIDAGQRDTLIAAGLLRRTDTHLIATDSGRQRLNAVLAKLLN